MFNFVDAAIQLEHSGESTVHHSIFLGRLSLLGRPGHPKVDSIKNLRSFAIVSVFRINIFLSKRSRSSRSFRLYAIVPVVFPYNRPGRLDVI